MTTSALLDHLERTPPVLRAAALVEHIVARLCEALFIEEPGRVHARSRFAELGLDSKRALALKEDLEDELGCRLSTTLFFDYPTPERLAAHLVGTVLASEPQRDAADTSNPSPTSPTLDEPTTPEDFDARMRRTFDKYGL
ncbi:acyl carrier protein [Trinickia fusca]|uniref:Carrier domain-containing protein n=1 Tax=Trinickia fusca TaxID=2419777 RepID=A0A494XAY9_9BURK|nr:acyl carrier protein [Trinickia fusca]RKP45284.1 hypothetical protein D7S89_20910 [Trinickia fusca]